MSFQKGKAKTGGRQSGTPNVITGAFRDAIRIAFTGLGGHENFLAWAKDHQTEFYKIAARLIPGEMPEDNGGKHLTIIVNRGGGPVLDIPPALDDHATDEAETVDAL